MNCHVSVSRKWHRQSGFSIIELIIALAIGGIVALMASAAYDSYNQRAQVAAAKSYLAALYEFEMQFSSEYDSFTTRLDSLGYQLDGDINWTIGFPGYAGDFPAPPAAPQGTASCNRSCYESQALPDTFCNHNPHWRCIPPGGTSGFSSAQSIAHCNGNSFRAEAHLHPYGTVSFAISVYLDESKNVIVDYNAN